MTVSSSDSTASCGPPSRCPLKKIRALPWGQALVAGTLVLTLIGHWHFLGWISDLASHFQHGYALGLIVAMILLLCQRRWLWSVLAGLSLWLVLLELVPLWQAPIRPASLDTQRPPLAQLTLLHANVHIQNADYSRIIPVIQAEQPDLISVQEISEAWRHAVEPALQDYPYRIIAPPAHRTSGRALYSRIPLLRHKLHELAPHTAPVILAGLQLPDSSDIITVVSAHPLPPVTPELYRHRNAVLDGLNRIRPNLGAHLIVIGDLNTTPWSGRYKQLTQHSNLINSAEGFGWRPTWPSVLGGLGLPIDHVLTSPTLQAQTYRLGPDIGSDHRPIVVTLDLLPQRPIPLLDSPAVPRPINQIPLLDLTHEPSTPDDTP